MTVNTTPEEAYSNSVSSEHRKKYAQFFTPSLIADIMSEWLLCNKKLHCVLEPAFGLGIFSRTLLAKTKGLSIVGYDTDNLILSEAKHLFANTSNIKLSLQDYMTNDWDASYDGIICNPPYFKFHDYDNKNVIAEIEKRLSLTLNGFTNLYALFLLKSIYQLKPGGRCAYIVPSEFLNSDYGKLVKAYLIKSHTLRYIIVFDSKENVFDDAITTSCIILCANDKLTTKVQFANLESIKDLNAITNLFKSHQDYSLYTKTYSLTELDPNIKWKSYYQKQNSVKFNNLVPFSKYAKVMRGIATGSNDYFTFNLSKAKEFGITEKDLMPCVCKSADVGNSVFSNNDFDTLVHNDKKAFLLNVRNLTDKNIAAYVKKGEDEGIDKRYLTSCRNPWYALEKRPPSPIWVTVFNRNGLRFIKNEAGVSNLTTFHCIYLKENLFSCNVNIDLFFAYLLTTSAHSIFEDNAREYGNGLQKFEPNDLNEAMMLDITQISNAAKEKIKTLHLKSIESNDCSYSKQIDEILLDIFAI